MSGTSPPTATSVMPRMIVDTPSFSSHRPTMSEIRPEKNVTQPKETPSVIGYQVSCGAPSEQSGQV